MEKKFVLPMNRRKSQLFFSTDIFPADIVESHRMNDATNQIKSCALKLRDECKSFEFNLYSSYCDAKDLRIATNSLNENRPKIWTMFFKNLFQQTHMSSSLKRKCDLIFQNIYYIIHNGRKNTAIHTSIAQSIHDECRSKKLISVFNNLGLCISYDEIYGIDYLLADRILKTMENHRVPVPSAIVPSKHIHGAMDNFDHIENSQSGKGSSHDTILMVFQNNKEISEDRQEISCKPLDVSSNRCITNILDCQKQISFHRPGRASIPKEFIPNLFHMPDGVINSALCEDIIWPFSTQYSVIFSV